MYECVGVMLRNGNQSFNEIDMIKMQRIAISIIQHFLWRDAESNYRFIRLCMSILTGSPLTVNESVQPENSVSFLNSSMNVLPLLPLTSTFFTS